MLKAAATRPQVQEAIRSSRCKPITVAVESERKTRGFVGNNSVLYMARNRANECCRAIVGALNVNLMSPFVSDKDLTGFFLFFFDTHTLTLLA